MKFLKLSAIAFGALAMMTGFGSCEKDEEECCRFTYTYDGNKITARACEDSDMKVTYEYADGSKETYSYDWHDEYDSWSELKQAFLDYGGSCD